VPLKLVEPRAGKSPNYTIRGAYLGVSVDKTAGTPVKAKAKLVLDRIKDEIERGAFAVKGELTFSEAAEKYLDAGGSARFVLRLVEHFGERPARLIDSEAIDAAAKALYPTAAPATRNRQVHTPVSAVLRHAGIDKVIKRPKGAAGVAKVHWLWPEQFAALAASAASVDGELRALFVLLVSTGLRISEALSIRCADVRLKESFAFVGKTKNGEPRPVYLPPAALRAIESHPRGLDRDGRLFRWTKSGLLYVLAERAFADAGIEHGGQPFHILRHTYGSWMRRYADLDERGLTDTGAWKDAKSARRYTHTVVSESAMKADLLPIN
jgi:integrase